MRRLNSYVLVGAIVAVVVLLVGGFFVWRSYVSGPSYTAVYLKTGDLYFGKLERFPQYGLRQPYLLQFNKENAQAPFSLQNFKNAVWGPEDFIALNREEIVWTANLRADSNLVKVFTTNPDLIPDSSASQQPMQAPASSTQPSSAPKR